MDTDLPTHPPATIATRSSPTRSRLLIAGLLAAHALFSLLGFGAFYDTPLAAISLAQPACLAAWALLGPASYWLQIPRMLLLAAAVFAVRSFSAAQHEIYITGMVTFDGLIFTSSLILFAILVIVRGWRLVPIAVQDRAAAARLKQMSLAQIFLDIALAAAVLALWRYLPEAQVDAYDLEAFANVGAILFLIPLLAPLLPLVALATDCDPRHTSWRIITALGCCALVSCVLFIVIRPSDIAIRFTAALDIAFLTTLVSYFVLRLAGYRLINRRTLPAAAAREPA